MSGTATFLIELRGIQRATLAARVRLNDAAISTRLKKGQIQVVRVTYPSGGKGKSIVEPISEWMSIADCEAHLDTL